MRLLFTDELKTILKKLGDDPVATFLLKAHKREDLCNKFIYDLGLSNSKGLITFDGIYSYEDSELVKVSENKGDMKVGRMFKNIFKTDHVNSVLTASEVEKFVNKFKAATDLGTYFQIFSGDEVKEMYREENYYGYGHSEQHEGHGTLWSSCMRNKMYKCGDWFVQNEVKMLALMKDGKLKGRALLWDDASFDGMKRPFMDRVYVVEDSDFNKFFDWAIENGYVRKEVQSYDHHDSFIDECGITFKCNLSVKVNDIQPNDGIPYIDTLFYLNHDNTITNHITRNSYYLARDPEGDIKEIDVVNDWQGNYIPYELTRSTVDGYVFSKECIELHDGTYAHNSLSIEIKGLLYHKNNVRKSDRYKDYIFIKDNNIIELSDGDFVYKEDAVTCCDGDVHFIYECNYSNLQGGFVHHKDRSVLNGDVVHRDFISSLAEIYTTTSSDIIRELKKEVGNILPNNILNLAKMPFFVLYSRAHDYSLSDSWDRVGSPSAKDTSFVESWAKVNQCDFIETTLNDLTINL